VNYIALDFIQSDAANGDIRPMAEQIRRGIAWAYRNAASFGGDNKRFYLGGHSSGGHLCSVALVTDWQKDFGLPADMVTGGLLMSGIFDLKPARLSARSSYIKFDDDMEQTLSSMRHIDMLRAPISVTYGSNETPEFQRQSHDFATAVKATGKPVELIEAPNFNHFEMVESLGNPYGPNGLAALRMMKLA
jgi:arylformamidase